MPNDLSAKVSNQNATDLPAKVGDADREAAWPIMWHGYRSINSHTEFMNSTYDADPIVQAFAAHAEAARVAGALAEREACAALVQGMGTNYDSAAGGRCRSSHTQPHLMTGAPTKN